jgi:hypothetical protein
VPEAEPITEPEPEPETEPGPLEIEPSTAFISTRGVERREADGPELRRGLIRTPAAPEARIWDSLAYPLWDASGVAVLMFVAPALWLTSLPVLVLIPKIAREGGNLLVMGPFAFPMAIAFVLALGYALLFLGRVLVSSAVGEVAHPRLPDWDVEEMLGGLGRWAWAGLVGFAVGGVPALAYWVRCGHVDFVDAVIIAELAILGASYAQMALVASLLHDSVWAANPITVFRAIGTVGWSFARPCLLTGACLLLTGVALAILSAVESDLLAAVGLWAVWVLVLYEAMVVLRVLGLFYRRHAAALGWFRERPQWGR